MSFFGPHSICSLCGSNIKRAKKHFKPGAPPWYFLVCIVSPRFQEVFSRSMHCRGINPISLWIVYSWGVSFWSHSILFTLWLKWAEKHFYPLILTLFTVLLQFHNFFCERTKIFLGAQKYHHCEFLMFFKGDAISHPLNSGATPWYFASSLYINDVKKFPETSWPCHMVQINAFYARIELH